MGRIKCESHFSHPHPLTLISHADAGALASSCCSGCKLKPSGMIYSCTICNFFLHQKCFQMPNIITHPFHKDHPLTLLSQPAYAGGEFNCDACAERGSGFSYHCKPCGLDLHILCAAAPLSLTTACHAHKLGLAFASPYDTKSFVCDVCSFHGGDHWLYRCNACGFDAHLKCATRSAPAPSRPHGGGQYLMGGAALGVPAGSMAMGVNGQVMNMIQNNNVNEQMMMQMIQNSNAISMGVNEQIIRNNYAMALAQAGRGGGGGDAGLQQMMQLISAFNRTGLGSGGGGLESLLGGGGGLESLLGGGGLESLLGGGGGLDFLGGLL